MNRNSVAALSLSAAALIGIAGWEGYKGEAYIPVPGDVPTIGFGSTVGVKMGDKTDPVRALIRLEKEADEYAAAVKRCAPYPMHQYEFDAFSSLTYNVGQGNFCTSTIPSKLAAGNYAAACKTILDFNKQCIKRVAGKCVQWRVLRGLTNRREAEYKQCIGAV